MNQILNIPRMLISDDDRDLRESLSQFFVSKGFETLLAEDGRQALELVCNQEVHVVLIDFNMPRMTGLEALKQIKQHHFELPVILMSAELDHQLAQQVLSANAFSVHAKPINIADIRTDVSRALRTIYNWSIDC